MNAPAHRMQLEKEIRSSGVGPILLSRPGATAEDPHEATEPQAISSLVSSVWVRERV